MSQRIKIHLRKSLPTSLCRTDVTHILRCESHPYEIFALPATDVTCNGEGARGLPDEIGFEEPTLFQML